MEFKIYKKVHISIFILIICISSCASPKTKQKYKYSLDLTSPHSKNWEKHLNHFKGKSDIKMLEIGVFEGRSAVWFLENILTSSSSRYVGIDLGDNELMKYNFSISPDKRKIKFLRGYSSEALKGLKVDDYDIVYIDGDHHSYGVLEDIMLSWPLLKSGGVMILDDYQMFQKSRVPQIFLPKDAIDYFLKTNLGTYEILDNDYQIIIKKIKNRLPPNVLMLGENLYLHWFIYSNNPDEKFLFKYDERGRREKIITTKLEMRQILSFISNRNKKHFKKLIKKFNITLE